jgi:pimeloyl-ACP methyl ester carboxylesterase
MAAAVLRGRSVLAGAYLDHGAGAPAVLVHASNTDHRIWAPHAEIIGQRFHVIAPTLRYFGPSRWPDAGQHFSVATHGADLCDFVEALGLGPVALVGWSYGAAACLAMAVRRPDLVQRLFLYEPAIATFVGDPIDVERAAADRAAMTSAARARLAAGDVSGAIEAFIDGVNGEAGAFGGLPDRVQQNMRDNSRTLGLLLAAPPPSLDCTALERLGTVDVVVIRGDATRVFYDIAAAWTTRCIPGSKLVVVSNARHLLPAQDAERFARFILDLLLADPPDRALRREVQ